MHFAEIQWIQSGPNLKITEFTAHKLKKIQKSSKKSEKYVKKTR
jgi:hypothetical protein